MVPLPRLFVLLVVTLWFTSYIHLAAAVESESKNVRLTFSCQPTNDLFLSIDHDSAQRFDSPQEAIEKAPEKSAVLILAEGYPEQRVQISQAALDLAKSKGLQLYIEYPESLPGVEFGPLLEVRWERGVVTSPAVGLAEGRILALHDCRLLRTEAKDPLMVMARVAGFDTAVYGLPQEKYPILFRNDDGILVATTKLSNFNQGRYAPAADWRTVWSKLLDELDPEGKPHKITAAPKVRPTYSEKEPLKSDAQKQAVARAAQWVHQSQLLVPEIRYPEIENSLRAGGGEAPIPPAGTPLGDGRFGMLEGYLSKIDPHGNQMQCIPLRADCQTEIAALLAVQTALNNDARSKQVSENLLNFVFETSGLHRGERGDPRHPSFGLIAWGDIGPAWIIGNYGDDNARTLLATMLAAAQLKSDRWDEAMLRALYANLRTTGRLGFRGDRVDVPTLAQYGWRHFHDAESVNLSPHFEAYLWACYLWAYERTGEKEFLDRTKIGIRTTMEGYPQGWRWGDNLERAHMLLPLAWLIRVEDTAEHRAWLERVTDDLLAYQAPCGAIAEHLRSGGGGHYVVPATNEAYGTGETPLIQNNGDPVSDQLYTTGFALLGLHEAAAATGDKKYQEAGDKLADYLIRIQNRSEAFPFVDGSWFRAFDYNRWETWASSADLGWGAWAVEAGWGPAWIPITLGLREQQTSLWDATASSAINKHAEKVKQLMAENDGSPYQAK